MIQLLDSGIHVMLHSQLYLYLYLFTCYCPFKLGRIKYAYTYQIFSVINLDPENVVSVVFGQNDRTLEKLTYIPKSLRYTYEYGPVGSNHGNLQNPPLLALGHRALRELPRCTVRG